MAEELQATGEHMAIAGVEYKRTYWQDVYIGAADALIAAGLVARHELPGEAGRGSTMCSFRRDGSPVGQGRTNCAAESGYRKIVRAGRRFRVFVTVEPEERDRRLAACARAQDAEEKVRLALEARAFPAISTQAALDRLRALAVSLSHDERSRVADLVRCYLDDQEPSERIAEAIRAFLGAGSVSLSKEGERRGRSMERASHLRLVWSAR